MADPGRPTRSRPKTSATARNLPAAPVPRLRPRKVTGKEIILEGRDEGPRGWFLPMVESAYSRLVPRGTPPAAAPGAAPLAGPAFASHFQPGGGEEVLAQPAGSVWRDLLAEYKLRRSVPRAIPGAIPLGAAPPAPVVPGGRNWLSLGPTVVLEGQTEGNQSVAGRISGLAVLPGGAILFAASANGGVFRSDDGGTSWRSLMDAFDQDPTDFASSSLACGAIAVDPADSNRIYVGTGEGDTHQYFRDRVVRALPAYRGIGPIRSDDGGATWSTEVTAAGSPELAGEAFFALALDPRDRDHVIGATTQGLYRRVPAAGGSFEWQQVPQRRQVQSSVVVTSTGGTTRFFAAEWGSGVFYSSDGLSWQRAGTAFPTANVGRIALGVQPNNPSLVYALVAATSGALHGLYRLDAMGGAWKKVTHLPAVLQGSQGGYDLAIAVDPTDADLVFLGGDRMDQEPYPASIWRCRISSTAAGFRATASASIGTHAHADVHVLAHTPGDSTELWCCCDGGVFLNRDPRGTGRFASQNDGLACLCCNFLGQHPTDPGILFTGLQDNGTAWTGNGPIWSHVLGGDGGYCQVNWAQPNRVLVFANGYVYRSESGGSAQNSWTSSWDMRGGTMTQPIVSPPFNPQHPSDAEVVAVGSGENVYVSQDFAASWPANLSFALPPGSGPVFALAFASDARLFVATTLGAVFRADLTAGSWSYQRLDDLAAGPLGLDGLISDIAIDWADASLRSIFIAFAGIGDRRRVWRFDGTRWESRSGLAVGSDLLDVEVNALVVDRAAPNNLYAGADIGVWHSSDSGLAWQPLQSGLPDAPVFDLQIHPVQRLLRAATYGRGVYEVEIL